MSSSELMGRAFGLMQEIPTPGSILEDTDMEADGEGMVLSEDLDDEEAMEEDLVEEGDAADEEDDDEEDSVAQQERMLREFDEDDEAEPEVDPAFYDDEEETSQREESSEEDDEVSDDDEEVCVRGASIGGDDVKTRMAADPRTTIGAGLKPTKALENAAAKIAEMKAQAERAEAQSQDRFGDAVYKFPVRKRDAREAKMLRPASGLSKGATALFQYEVKPHDTRPAVHVEAFCDLALAALPALVSDTRGINPVGLFRGEVYFGVRRFCTDLLAGLCASSEAYPQDLRGNAEALEAVLASRRCWFMDRIAPGATRERALIELVKECTGFAVGGRKAAAGKACVVTGVSEPVMYRVVFNMPDGTEEERWLGGVRSPYYDGTLYALAYLFNFRAVAAGCVRRWYEEASATEENSTVARAPAYSWAHSLSGNVYCLRLFAELEAAYVLLKGVTKGA